MSYEKEILTNITTVAGNIKDYEQSYDIKYYPKVRDLTDKIALYIYLGDKKAIRTLYFSSHEQLKTLIFNLTISYFYFLDKRIKPVIPIEQFRMIKLDEFLKDLRLNQTNIWKR